MSSDLRLTLATAPLSRTQVVAVAICVLLTAMDGFDVLAISFAAPGISSEWGIDRAALGIVLSMELFGMAAGSLAIGGLADRAGRRPSILFCLVLMSVGMYLASTADGVLELSAYRFFTGLGIGGMLACASAMAAEFSNARWRSFSVILMAAGYPMGVILGGTIASLLLVSFDWRVVFLFGAGASAALIPVVWLALPESIEYLLQRRPKGALRRINVTLGRMGHPAIDSFPPRQARQQDEGRVSGWMTLFSPQLVRTTLILTLAYFAHIMTFYFTLKWIPKIVVDMGFEPASAGGVLVWANVGGVCGAVIIGLLSQRYEAKKLVTGALVLGAAMVIWFGRGQAGLSELSLVAATVGFFTNSAVVGLYALFAQSFPTEVRAGGTGFAIGFGRAGSAAGPIVAGYLFASGATLSTVAFFMSLGSVLAAILLLFLKPVSADPSAER